MQWNGRAARGAALGVAALAVVIGGGVGAGALTVGAANAPAVTQHAGPGIAGADQNVKHGWLGLSLAALNDKLAQRLGLTQTTGIVVVSVLPDSPAAKAGVQQKDIVLKLNGAAVADMKAARTAVAAIKPGDVVSLTVQRGGQEQTIAVTAGEAPTPKARPMPARPGAPGMPGMGLGVPPVKELQGIPPAEMFSHMQSGSMTFTDKDGKPVTVAVTAGKVTAVAASSVTVQPNAGGAAVAYTVGADTIVRGRATELVQLKTDDPVVVVTVNSAAEARMIVSPPQARPAGGARQGGRGPQAQFFVSPDAMGAMGMSMGMAPGMGMGMGMPPTMAWMHSMADSEGDDLDALFQVAPFEDDDEVVAPPAAAPAMKVTAERDAMGGLRAMFRQGGPR